MKKILIIAALVLTACSPNWQEIHSGVYEGELEIQGSIIYKAQYIDDEKPHILVSDDDLYLLPRQDKAEYLLIDAPKLSEDTPITIKVTKIEYPMEGSPLMTFSEIAENNVE